ncbi:LOW QUALITY PROTEIN: thyrotropin-releasing hormone receptor-like [Oryx dammah]|uniref:LOW QUALITY PROTEIN: thyrotropin-releasing hormone receptor-like n=1 Tax=Oryx dammah TaxID=59534 RepID=UPI001A9A8566|nr:LOW QUALITY PROTEIN: thyrotropin-releasing hormone receptor-like [Oryx dammah]
MSQGDPTIQNALLQSTPPRERSRQLSSTSLIPDASEFPASRMVAPSRGSTDRGAWRSPPSTQRGNSSGPGFMPRPPLTVQAVTLTLVPLVCAVGVAGNAMVVLVVARSLHMVTSTNCYLVSLATADLLVLRAAGVPAVTEAASARVWIFGDAGCLGITYLQYVGINASTGSITAFTVERYLAICRPLSAQALCTAARAKRIAALVWLGTGAYCVLWLFLVDTRETAYADGVRVQCGYRVSRSLYLPVYFLDFALFYALPLGLATVCYALIARVLFAGPLPPGDPGRSGSVHQGGPAGQGHLSFRGRRGALNSRKQVAKMLAVVVVLFALLWLPSRALVVANSFLSPPYLNLGFLLFCRLCVYVNSAVNPIVYALMSQHFREALLFQCHLARPKPPPQEASPVYDRVVGDCSQDRLGSWKKPGSVMSIQEGDPATSRRDPPHLPLLR